MFVWVFHRISGVVLILLIGFKFLTGFGIDKHFGQESVEFWRALHNNTFINILLLFLFIYHSLYGLRTIIFDLGYKKEKELFWGFSTLGLILFIVLCLRFYLRP